ncbi:TetR/AcrR family transcriptional regulator [Candidatus Dependentiae bacterium]
MARIVKSFDKRHTEFLEAAKELFFSVGYEKMSVLMLTKRVGVAKGTFYHYFESKEELLTKWVIDEISCQTVPLCEKIANNPNLDALTKLNKIFKIGREWKLQNIDIIILLIKVMYGDNNIRLRNEMTRQSVLMIENILTKVIEQGVQEGVFNIKFPREISSRLLQIMQLFSQDLSLLILKHSKNKNVSIDKALKLVYIWQDIIERILGAPSGSIMLVNDKFLGIMFQYISSS